MKTLPLTKAYEFAAKNGLEREAEQIRRSHVRVRGYTSSVRRGYVIELFERHSLFDKFKEEHWPFGNGRGGATTTQRYRRLKEEFEQTK